MQTPYLIVKSRNPLDLSELTIDTRDVREYSVGEFRFLFFPPSDEQSQRSFDDRIHHDKNRFYYEDGFMVRYPEPYTRKVAQKLDLFDCPSYELDGSFSRITLQDGTVRIDGSGLYLQLLNSYQQEGVLLFSNNPTLLLDAVKLAGLPLSVNDDFFANHFFNYSLAYYANMGTPHNEIQFHDSLETIELTETVSTSLEDKFPARELADMGRDDRLALLHKRIRHVLDEYCAYIDVDVLGHNLTGGRDSRTSLAIFLQSQAEKLEIVTGGFSYIPDCVISNYVSKKYGIAARKRADIVTPRAFDYTYVMSMPNVEEYYIPMFRKIQISKAFNRNMFLASGYLGNVLTFTGTDKNQIMRDNRFKLTSGALAKLEGQYDTQIKSLSDVYGQDAHQMFNIMYNTTNKVASYCRRLKFNTFCIFELDVLHACYRLEEPKDKANSSLHYELMKIANPEMLKVVPFESSKSFATQDDTFEIQAFREAGNPRLYKRFLEKNFEAITKFLREHREHLSYLDDHFFDHIEAQNSADLPPIVCNKMYAALGSLRFKDIHFSDFEALEPEAAMSLSDLYNTEFFQRLYLDNQIYASGLAGMLYSDQLFFRSFVQTDDNENLRIVVREVASNTNVPVSLEKNDSAFDVSGSLPNAGKYLVIWSTYNTVTKKVNELHRLTFVAKFEKPDESEAAIVEKVA